MIHPCRLLGLALAVWLAFPPAARAQWQQVGRLEGGSVAGFAVKENILFAATSKGGVFLTTNNGERWISLKQGLPADVQCRCLAVCGTSLLVGTQEHGVFLSANNGGWWTASNAGLPDGTGVRCFEVRGPALFAGTSTSVFVSSDVGASWTGVNFGLPEGTGVHCLASNGEEMLAATDDGAVYITADGGAQWTSAAKGLPEDVHIYCLAGYQGNRLAGTEMNRILIAPKDGKGWKAIKGLPPGEVLCFAASGTTLFAGTGGGFDMMIVKGSIINIPHGAGVLMSTNAGVTWEKINEGLRPAPDIPALRKRIGFWIEEMAVCGPYLFAGTEEGEIWRRPVPESGVGKAPAAPPSRSRPDERIIP